MKNGDLISRHDAVNELQEYITEPSISDDESEIIGYNDGIELAISVLSTMPSAQRWTPCSERLPEEDGVYIVTTSKGQVQQHVFNINGNSKEYWMRCNIAWMPSPEPYKRES